MTPSSLRVLLGVLACSLLVGACSPSPEPSPESSPESTGSSPGSSQESTASGPESTRELSFGGPEPGALVGADELGSVEFAVTATLDNGRDPQVGDLRIRLDGDDVTPEAQVDGGTIRFVPARLDEGKRTVQVVSLPERADGQLDRTSSESAADDRGEESADGENAVTGTATDDGDVLHEWSITVDTTAPPIDVTAPDTAAIAGEPVTIVGTTEPDATVTAAGSTAEADDTGHFSLDVAAAAGSLGIVTADAAGNATNIEVELVTIPSRVEIDEIRAVHVSFCAWATPSLREPVLDMVESGAINAVQLDLKDETGTIGFDSGVELAATIGADQPPCRIDLAGAVELLHDLGVPIIGRIVAFADPVLAPWAWEHDRRDWVMQTADGGMYTGRYDGFSNFANAEVVEYNLDIAEAAAAAGVDHILWDYIRKPDGPAENFRFAGLEGEPGDGIVEFTRRADERIAPYGVVHGASVYGISADRPTEVAQNIPAMADHLDYVAPMLYPSHWAPGEYGIADPLNQPHETIATTLEIWLDATDGKRARVVPWLEDSNWPVSLGYPDRADYVTKQIQATYDVGIEEWLLWDSSVDYTSSAISPPTD